MEIKRWFWASFLLLSLPSLAGDIRAGAWSGSFFLNDSAVMPFRFDVEGNRFIFLNGEERLEAASTVAGDSVTVTMPVFDAVFRLKILGDTLRGVFVNNQRKTNREIRCQAVAGRPQPLAQAFELENFSGRWSSIFDGDDPPLDRSVAEFVQKGNRLTGTFLTSTGDYRYLEGYADGTSFELSAFDGSHVFYFTAALDGDTLRGHFYSGTHWHDTWKAWRDETAALPDADSLAFLKPGYTSLAFSFPDENGRLVSIGDAQFKSKVVLVQLMGSWCPNCMDEAAVLSALYPRYRERGLEIIALDFERIDSFLTAAAFIKKFKNHFSITYPILFAGSSDRKKRAAVLPQLSDIVALPTLIYTDRKGQVRKVHTGFSGQATGKHFEKWKDDFMRFVEALLDEK